MTGRLLQRLDAAVAATTSRIDGACLRAERAVLLARLGRAAEARAQLAAVREAFAHEPHAAVTAWACLAEGLLDHFDDSASVPRDRLQRAHALAAAARLAPLQALAAAWLAHALYVAGDDAAMAARAAESLALAAPDHHAARSRACLVVARAYHLAGRFDAARGYYTQAREHAGAEGDDATLSAIMYDMAGHWVQQSQLAELFDEAAGADASQALLGAECWGYFDRRTGTMVQESLVEVVRAQALVVQGRHVEALALYERHLAAALTQGLARREPLLRADMAWCRQRLGQGDVARTTARTAEAGLPGDADIDDRAIAHARLAAVFAAIGPDDAAARHREQAARDWSAWQAQRLGIAQALDSALAAHRPSTG